MDLSYKQEVTVGGLVILAIGLFIVGTTWLSGKSVGGDSGDYYRVQFTGVPGLKPSSAVRISGVQVGRVEEITLVELGKVIVSISLDEQIVPKTDAKAQVAAVGFVGDAAIDLNPGTAAQPLPKGQIIAGTQSVGLTDRAEALSHRADSVMMGLQTLLSQQTTDEMHKTLQALQGTLKMTQQVMAVYANPKQGPTAALTETMVAFKQLGVRLDSTLGNPELVRALSRSDTLAQRLTAMTAQFTATGARLDSTLALIQRGEGTLGKFATDSGFYNDMRATTQQFKTLLEELTKHPGKIAVTIKPF